MKNEKLAETAKKNNNKWNISVCFLAAQQEHEDSIDHLYTDTDGQHTVHSIPSHY